MNTAHRDDRRLAALYSRAFTHQPAGRFYRPLRLESLEDRRLLAITVDALGDVVDGNFSAGQLSLREAIANAAPGDTIQFAPALTSAGPATI